MVCWLVVWLRGSLSLSRVFGVRFVVVRGCAEFVLAGLVGSGGSGLRGRRRSMALSGGHFQETNKKVWAVLSIGGVSLDVRCAVHSAVEQLRDQTGQGAANLTPIRPRGDLWA